MKYLKYLKYFLLLNGALDLFLAANINGLGFAVFKANFQSPETPVNQALIEATLKSFLVHGMIRIYAGLDFDSLSARIAAQISYLGEFLYFLDLFMAGGKLKFPDAGAIFLVTPLSILALEYVGKGKPSTKDD